MAYDERFAERIRAALGPRRLNVDERKMFGGIAFMLKGKMFCGIAKNRLMLRVGPERYDAFLAKPHVLPMDFTGRPLRGYIYVEPAGYATARALAKWVDVAASFVEAMKPVVPKRRARGTRAAKR